jgi:hypothetical protein
LSFSVCFAECPAIGTNPVAPGDRFLRPAALFL